MNLFDLPHDLCQSESPRAASFATLHTALVTGANGEQLTVAGDFGVVNAKRAVSCMVVPVVGDTVSVWSYGRQPEQHSVIAVLERNAESVRHLNLGTHAVVTCESLTFRAKRASAVVSELQSVAQRLSSCVRDWICTGGRWSTVFDGEVHHAKQYTREVDGIDRAKAKVVEIEAEDAANLRAPHVITTGDKLVKVLGAQIHMG